MPTVQRPGRSSPGNTYTPEVTRAAFGSYFKGPESSDGEQPMFCPLCEDPDTSKSASASINVEEGVWHCAGKCGAGGTVVDLVAQLKKSGFSMHTPRTSTRPTPAKALKPLEDQTLPEAWRARLQKPANAKRLAALTETRGLTPDTIERFCIGWDGQRYTIPVLSADGVWVNVRRYKPGADLKMLNLPGHGTNVLYPVQALADNGLPVLLLEGELDALVANQIGAGRFEAVTGTGGAGNVPRDLSALRDREVFIAYDHDEAGRIGAEKIAQALVDLRARVHIVDWSRLGLPEGDKSNKDFTDWVMKGKGTAERLLAEMDELRASDPNQRDEIDEFMEAAFLGGREPRRDYTAALLSEDDILARPPGSSVIEPFVVRGMVSVAFGAPGSFKTFVGQDMSYAVRAGMDWHGHAVAPGAVLLFEAEGLQQLQDRIVALTEHHGALDLAAFRAVEEPLSAGTPEGAAAIVRTVQGMQAATGEKVELIWVDPAALYMAGSENEDGNLTLALGLNAVAKYLDIGVLVIVHTNASGERARGTDHFRMLSGSYFRVEKLDPLRVGVVQEKVKNTYPHAVILSAIPVGPSLVLTTEERMSAAEYEARKSVSNWTQKSVLKLSEATAAAAVKHDRATEMILETVAARPGISKTQLLDALMGKNIGSPALNSTRERLVDEGQLVTREGPRKALLHYLPTQEVVSE